jgi:hypothetical protein
MRLSSEHDRPNRRLAALVEAALELRMEYDERAAAAFLTAAGADFALTVRVLSEPERRRPRAVTKLAAGARPA